MAPSFADLNPVGLPVYKLRGFSEKEMNLELSPEEATKLQQAAWNAVLECKK